jgi:hypothetical protein
MAQLEQGSRQNLFLIDELKNLAFGVLDRSRISRNGLPRIGASLGHSCAFEGLEGHDYAEDESLKGGPRWHGRRTSTN